MKETTKEFKIFFLKEFTRQLIKSSNSAPFFELKKIVDEEEKNKEEEIIQRKEEIKEIIKEKSDNKKIIQSDLKLKINPKRPLPIFQGRKVLRIPQPKLPSNLSYLRPTATALTIDLGKLNPFIKDFNVKEIECNGPDEKLIVRGLMGEKSTAVTLSKEEINEIIDKISKEEKIPADEGIFRVVVGNLNFSAIISEVVGTKFLIKKIR